MGFNACTCSLDHLDPTSNAHGAPAKCLDLICNRRATVRQDSGAVFSIQDVRYPETAPFESDLQGKSIGISLVYLE